MAWDRLQLPEEVVVSVKSCSAPLRGLDDAMMINPSIVSLIDHGDQCVGE